MACSLLVDMFGLLKYVSRLSASLNVHDVEIIESAFLTATRDYIRKNVAWVDFINITKALSARKKLTIEHRDIFCNVNPANVYSRPSNFAYRTSYRHESGV